MNKKKNPYHIEDSRYQDGYRVDKRKTAVIDKRKEKRFERALRVKNIDAILDVEEDDDDANI